MKQASRRETSGHKRRIVVVERHPLMREAIKQVVNRQPVSEVCAEAESATAAFAAVRSLQPELAITGLSLPDRSALDFIKCLRLEFPDVLVLVFSAQDENIYAERALRAGAHGYLMKTETPQRLAEAIHKVLSGNIYVSERVSTRVLTSLTQTARRQHHSPLASLTDREFEIFQLIGQGFTTQEIGHRLHVSPKTVETHRLHIKTKLHLQSRPEMITHAIRWVATMGQA